jgi:hypothetical protein
VEPTCQHLLLRQLLLHWKPSPLISPTILLPGDLNGHSVPSSINPQHSSSFSLFFPFSNRCQASEIARRRSAYPPQKNVDSDDLRYFSHSPFVPVSSPYPCAPHRVFWSPLSAANRPLRWLPKVAVARSHSGSLPLPIRHEICNLALAIPFASLVCTSSVPPRRRRPTGAPSPSKSRPWPPRSTRSDDLTVIAGESLVN